MAERRVNPGIGLSNLLVESGDLILLGNNFATRQDPYLLAVVDFLGRGHTEVLEKGVTNLVSLNMTDMSVESPFQRHTLVQLGRAYELRPTIHHYGKDHPSYRVWKGGAFYVDFACAGREEVVKALRENPKMALYADYLESGRIAYNSEKAKKWISWDGSGLHPLSIALRKLSSGLPLVFRTPLNEG